MNRLDLFIWCARVVTFSLSSRSGSHSFSITSLTDLIDNLCLLVIVSMDFHLCTIDKMHLQNQKFTMVIDLVEKKCFTFISTDHYSSLFVEIQFRSTFIEICL